MLLAFYMLCSNNILGKQLKTKTTLTPTSGDVTSIEVVTISVVMVVEKSSGQEQEGEDMNEILGSGVEAEGERVEGEILVVLEDNRFIFQCYNNRKTLSTI